MLKNVTTKKIFRWQGFSLVELLIALFLGTMLVTMVIGLYTTCISTGSKNLKMSRLRSDLQSLVALIETDIRRAGYGGSDYLVGVTGDQTIDINTSNDCIVYYYDHDNNGNLESADKMAFSFQNHIVKFKTGVGKIANTECVDKTGWENVSYPNIIKITELSFTEIATSTVTTTQRSIKLTLAGELVSDSSYHYSITTQVKVRNLEFTY